MNLTPVEWSEAQQLLLKLVEVLVPLAERPVSVSLFLNHQRFLAPLAKQGSLSAFAFRHPVSLLKSVQARVDQWIGEKPLERDAPPSSLDASPLPNPSESSLETQSKSPLSKQAQELIRQVQDAIGKLCSSKNIKNPEEAPLREALRRLKPNLDGLIETVKQEGVPADLPIPLTRFSPPPLLREQLVKKLAPWSNARPVGEEPFEKRAQRSSDIPLPREASDSKLVSRTDPLERRGGESSTSNLSQETNQKGEKSLFATASQDFDPPPHLKERTYLPGAPFVSDRKNLISPSSKKKKRKGFWFRDEKEEGNNS